MNHESVYIYCLTIDFMYYMWTFVRIFLIFFFFCLFSYLSAFGAFGAFDFFSDFSDSEPEEPERRASPGEVGPSGRRCVGPFRWLRLFVPFFSASGVLDLRDEEDLWKTTEMRLFKKSATRCRVW